MDWNGIVQKLHEVKTGIYAEVIRKIEEIESISTNFNHTNLKIHDVSYYLYLAQQDGIITSDQALDLFQHICEFEYMYFQEWEIENLSYVERVYIGHTSSFYYNSKKWYGYIVDNEILEELLEGKAVLKECLKDMYLHIYDYLVEGKENYENIDFDDIEANEELLNLLSDDLDTVLEIVSEAKKAYDFLKEYKTEENEYELAKENLKNEITEYYCDVKAEKLFGDILINIDKLNKVETLTISHSKNTVSNTYEVNVSVNKEEFAIDTEINFSHELSEKYIQSAMQSLSEKINENFELVH